MKKFIILEVNDITNNRLLNYCQDNNLKNNMSYSGKEIQPWQFRFHVTIMASENSPIKYLPNGSAYNIPSIELVPSQTGLIGNNIPCLFLEPTSELEELKLETEISFGLRHRYEDFIPHMSLSYNTYLDKEFNIELPNFSIIANKIKISDDEDQTFDKKLEQLRYHNKFKKLQKQRFFSES